MDLVTSIGGTALHEGDDAADIARAVDSPDAFQRVFERHHDRIRAYVATRVGPGTADDVVAETFVEAFRIRHRFDPASGSNAAPWLLGIATNMIARNRAAERRWIERCSRAPHEVAMETSVDEVVSRLDAATRRAALVAAVGAIPARERAPLLLHVLGGCSYEEVAVALDIPVGTVRSRISRGRARLRDRMNEGEQDA